METMIKFYTDNYFHGRHDVEIDVTEKGWVLLTFYRADEDRYSFHALVTLGM